MAALSILERNMTKQEFEVSRDFESEVLKKFLCEQSDQKNQEMMLRNIEKSYVVLHVLCEVLN